VAVLGIDQPAYETVVNLITGTTLPDRGEVRVFGLSTAQIKDGEEWMSVVDRFGFVSERAVLLEALSVAQNLSIPFSLDVEPPSPELRERAVALAKEVGLGPSTWDARVAGLDALSRARVRLGRALALEPSIVLFEHPTAAMPGKSDVGSPRFDRAGLTVSAEHEAFRPSSTLAASAAGLRKSLTGNENVRQRRVSS
jgi:ABC-type transporter Mla maintaining outer membrane lipid asymmetry ATPase subunit MlaF